MKHILLPTDLTVHSLWLVHQIIANNKQQPVTIHVIHMLKTPSGISDLFSLRSNNAYQLVPLNFKEAFQMLKNKNQGNANLQFDFIYGSNKRVLNNYMEGKGVSEVYLLDNHAYNFTLKESVDFIAFFNKCKYPVQKINLQTQAISEYQILSALLNGNEQQENIRKAEKRVALAS